MPRRAECIPTLGNHGLLRPGTVIEVLPELLPNGASGDDPRFRARIVHTRGRDGAVEWEQDHRAYSLTELTHVLWNEHGLGFLGQNFILKHWRIEGRDQSMWEDAEQFPR